MAKQFTFINLRTQKTLFETVEPNHVSFDDVAVKMKKETGIDPRITSHIEEKVRVVPDVERK